MVSFFGGKYINREYQNVSIKKVCCKGGCCKRVCHVITWHTDVRSCGLTAGKAPTYVPAQTSYFFSWRQGVLKG